MPGTKAQAPHSYLLGSEAIRDKSREESHSYTNCCTQSAVTLNWCSEKRSQATDQSANRPGADKILASTNPLSSRRRQAASAPQDGSSGTQSQHSSARKPAQAPIRPSNGQRLRTKMQQSRRRKKPLDKGHGVTPIQR